MKPHDETMAVDHRSDGHRIVSKAGMGHPLDERSFAYVYTPSRDDAAGILTWEQADATALATATLLAAAPEMARALLHVLECKNVSGQCQSCQRTARAALTRAGVPLP